MTTEEKTLLSVLAIAAVLVPITLGAAFDWPAWSWLLLTVPLLGVVGLVVRNIYRRMQYELPSQPYVEPSLPVEQQDPGRQTPVGDLTLPSASTGYDFHFSATVYWRPTRGLKTAHANLGKLAVDAILVRARAITAAEQQKDVDIVQHRLASELGTVRRDTTGMVEAWADHVQLTLSEVDQQRLRKFLELCKNEHLWEYERNYERRKLAYLRDEVMKDTGSAVIWCLVQKDNDVEDTVRLLGPLAQLSAAVNNIEVPELFRHLVPTPVPPGQLSFNSLAGDRQVLNGSFDGSRQTTGFPGTGLAAGPFSDVSPVTRQWGALMDTLSVPDEERHLFTRYFAQLIDKFGGSDAAQEIHRHCDTSGTDKEPVHVTTPDDDLPGKLVPDVEPARQEEPWRNSPLSGDAEEDGQSQTEE
jgi:hypothetical protein